MSGELAKQYDPSVIEEPVFARWLEEGAYAAVPDQRENRYVIMMPLPNVTGALHMGHAMDNVMQDLLCRWHRMLGDNTLWQPGTDHAGIATQAIVEKRLFELEGKTRHDIGREALVQRIQDWKEQFQARIIKQQQTMGCGCDWNRQRFTMDAICARAVRHCFFSMFRDGLIYRGSRLVNWDCHLQTAVADDEIVHETTQGHFWHLRYPVIDPRPGEPNFVIVATTRPETMLGDTAVACHPDPRAVLEELRREARERLDAATEKDRPAAKSDLEKLDARWEKVLPGLEKLRDMASEGRKVLLPLQERPIPIITDEWAKPELGSGCVKITPAHDPNDYEVWTRHADEIDIINILEPSGALNENAGSYQGIDRLVARKTLLEDLESKGFLENVEDREVEIGHSDRSKTPIEPYLSKQWFVRMGDVAGGVVCGRGTPNEFRSPGLAQAAIDAVDGDWTSASGRKLKFHPDSERYAGTYLNWLGEKRDWCISRQLWWGHQIPIWWGTFTPADLPKVLSVLESLLERDDVSARVSFADGSSQIIESGFKLDASSSESIDVQVGLRDSDAESEVAARLAEVGLNQDGDVLDTWFSSGLWPMSTLGWPDPETAAIEPGQTSLASDGETPNSLDYYYPGSCLVTGRDIITLWVVRMQMMGLYCLGDIPFTDCFIHANILDGKGERMSKSKGNGIDPADIIAQYGTDAMRYVVCEMQTGMQDIRLPIQAISPFTGEKIDLAKAKHGRSIFTYICPGSKKEFDVLGTLDDVPSAKLVSDRFEVGRNFCNKLWNALRFALLNLEGTTFEPRSLEDLAPEDRWILSRLARATQAVTRELEAYNPAAAIGAAREFFWSQVCDWYVELIKPRMREPAEASIARQVLATVLDQLLRILQPFVPFIAEALWERLNDIAPQRGIDRVLPSSELIVTARWPEFRSEWEDDDLEEKFRFFQDVVRGIRDIRSKYSIPPSQKIEIRIRAADEVAERLHSLGDLLSIIAGISSLEISETFEASRDAAIAIVGEVQIFVPGVVDLEQEKAKLAKQRDQLNSRIEGARKKLANENFVSRAKPEVVERERQRLGEMEAELASVDENLVALS